jgi:uncharacterized phage infection (PIP) family protein YhgE
MSEEVAQIKSAIDDVKEKLEKIKGKKDSIRDSVYQKVKEDYERRLNALNEQLAGKKESLKETLKEIATKKQPLKSKLDELQEQLEEIELRHSIGEYEDGQYDSMSSEIKEKMAAIEGDLTSINKEEEQTMELLGEPVDVIDEEAVGEKVEEEKVEEYKKEEDKEKEVEEEPLPEVSEENMIAEELFTGREQTAEESESVIPDVSVDKELRKEKEEEEEEGEDKDELFDMTKAKSGAKTEEESSDGLAEEEDWLSSLEQELNEEAEEKEKKGKKEKTDKKEVKAEKDEGGGGEELVSLCPKCNYKNKPDAWYCENCGAELASPD